MMSRRRFAGWLAGLAGLVAGKGWGMSRRACPDPHPRWSLRRTGDDIDIMVEGVPWVPDNLIEPAIFKVNHARFLDLAAEPGQLMMGGYVVDRAPGRPTTLAYLFRYRREGWGREILRDGTSRPVTDRQGVPIYPPTNFHHLPYMPAERTMP